MFNRKIYMKEYRKNHLNEIREKSRKWRKNNPEKIKQYYELNREKTKERAREWHKNHPNETRDIRKRYNKKRKQYVDDYKLSKGCAICGYHKCALALVFHHSNGDKIFTIASAVAAHRKWKEVEEEMGKCEILCCRCHRELHAKEQEEKY